MKKMTYILSGAFFLASLLACSAQEPAGQKKNNVPSNVLVFSKTEGFRHNSIPDGIALMKQFAANDRDLSVTATENASQISTDNLKNYGAVVFLNTTGDVLNETQQAALKQFVENGGGFMGIHAATDTEYNWPWYGRMIGAYFDGHPPVQEATLYVLSNGHLSTQYLPGEWTRTDEWYNFRDIQSYINPLINLDETSYEGGTNGQNHPAAWYHKFKEGRVFYTAGGHTKESYNDQMFSRHLLGGLKYVLGK